MGRQFEELLTKKEIASALKVKATKTIEKFTRQGMPMFSTKPPRYLESECREWLKNRGKDET